MPFNPLLDLLFHSMMWIQLLHLREVFLIIIEAFLVIQENIDWK